MIWIYLALGVLFGFVAGGLTMCAIFDRGAKDPKGIAR